MTDAIEHVVILGGGSAGWLTAAVLAAEHNTASGAGLKITLIESPDVPIIGVGEGTWPTMRDTLRRTGVTETDFIRECDGAFKQGSKFVGWAEGNAGDYYYHPFVLPQGFLETNVVTPLTQQRVVNFPPALLIAVQLVMAAIITSPLPIL